MVHTNKRGPHHIRHGFPAGDSQCVFFHWKSLYQQGSNSQCQMIILVQITWWGSIDETKITSTIYIPTNQGSITKLQIFSVHSISFFYAIKVWANVFFSFICLRLWNSLNLVSALVLFLLFLFFFSMRKEALWNWLQLPLIQFKSDIYEDSLSSNRKVWKNPTMKNASWPLKGTYPCKFKTVLFVHRKRIKK